jgi:hypothetical protein
VQTPNWTDEIERAYSTPCAGMPVFLDFFKDLHFVGLDGPLTRRRAGHQSFWMGVSNNTAKGSRAEGDND